MPTITSQQKRELKSQLHILKPVVIIGNNGLTDSVIQEINRALDDHELIKIRIDENDRSIRENMITKVCKSTNAVLIQSIGKIAALYRKMAKKDADTE